MHTAFDGCLSRAGVAQGEELANQRCILERLLDWAKTDGRVVAVHLKGSLGRGEGDRHSDIDVVLDVRPDDWAATWDERALWTAPLGDTVHRLEHQWGPITDTVCYAVLYRNGVYLDVFIHCGFQPTIEDGVTLWTRDGAASSPTPAVPFGNPVSAHDDLEDLLDIYWMGATLAAKYIIRRDLWLALDFIGSQRSSILRAWRLVHRPDHIDWGWHTASRDLPTEILTELAKAVPHFDAVELARALVRVTDVMARIGPELAGRRGISHPDSAVAAIRTMIREQLHPFLA